MVFLFFDTKDIGEISMVTCASVRVFPFKFHQWGHVTLVTDTHG